MNRKQRNVRDAAEGINVRAFDRLNTANLFPSLVPLLRFNRKREANPLATCSSNTSNGKVTGVSIANAKPILWRHNWICASISHIVVSIANAKPILWRHSLAAIPPILSACFNRKREANPLATATLTTDGEYVPMFQSQTRSQSSGDVHVRGRCSSAL